MSWVFFYLPRSSVWGTLPLLLNENFVINDVPPSTLFQMDWNVAVRIEVEPFRFSFDELPRKVIVFEFYAITLFVSVSLGGIFVRIVVADEEDSHW